MIPFLLAVDFMNFTYRTNPCPQNVPVPAVMRKGRFSYFDNKMGAGFDLYIDAVKRGSLEPGTRQAIVVITCEFPVGGTAAAYAFDERQSTAVLLGQVGTANWGPDWGAGPQSIRIRFANSRLYVDQCENTDCTQKSRTTYALRGGKFVKTGSSAWRSKGE